MDIQFLDMNYTPNIVFVKSKAMFKLSYKDCFGIHQLYFDFLPIKSNLPAVNELLYHYRLSNTDLERCPKRNTHPVNLKLKVKPKAPCGTVKKSSDLLFPI